MKFKLWGQFIFLVIFFTGCLPVISTELDYPSNHSSLAESQITELTLTQITTATTTATTIPTGTPFLPFTATTTPIPPTTTPTVDPNKILLGPGDVLIPILMYHHVSPYSAGSEYAVSLDQFRRQMQWLQEQGYQTILVSDMVEAVKDGKLLPLKPIILTFDDGFKDVYENAFPLLTEFGFTATIYLIEDVINKHPYMTDEMVETLITAGWEIGNHSKSHAHLPTSRDLENEVCLSRARLIERFNQPFESFAYPYAAKDDKSIQAVKDCGYTSSAGNGSFTIQTEERLFFFSRREIKSYFDMQRFITTVTDVR